MTNWQQSPIFSQVSVKMRKSKLWDVIKSFRIKVLFDRTNLAGVTAVGDSGTVM